jgi:hypothetical protein
LWTNGIFTAISSIDHCRYVARKNINPEAALLLEFYSLPNNPVGVKEIIIQNAE